MGVSAAAALSPLRHHSFAVLWTASLISNVGSWMQTVAVGALVISRTGSASWAVLVAAGAFLPIGLLSPLGGALADRLPRRPVIAAGNLTAGLIAAAIATLVAVGQDSPYALLALVTLQGAVAALIGPFVQAILPDLVPRSEFLAASSLNSAQWNAGRIAGPALAGAAIAAFGFAASFVANAASFLAVVIALLFIRLGPPPGSHGPLLSSIRDGLRAVLAEPSCRAATIAIGAVAFLAAPFIALVPAVALSLSHGSGPHRAAAVAATTAVLTTAQGAGAVAGALCLAPLAVRIGRGPALGWSLALLPAALIGYGAAGTLWLAAAALFAVGLVYMGALSGLQTVVQLRAPAAYRGRVLGFFLVALGVAYPVGALVQGPVADHIGVGATTAVAALLLAVAGLVTARRRPAFIRAMLATDQPEPAQPAADPSGGAEAAGQCAVSGTRPRMAR
ncbi:MAG TPA: MFS transporter [Streptosporangiaceae bacterium]|jgi:MFS family permease|nr:MFS transporter [Streptosporangiaceae bacterium]